MAAPHPAPSRLADRAAPIATGLPPRAAARVVAALGACCAGVLLGTWAFWDFCQGLTVPWEAAPPIKHVFYRLDLSTENVVAVWFSSMLLFLVAVASAGCFASDRHRGGDRRARVLRYGWLGLAVVFTLLSLDELGSVHERMAMMPHLNPFSEVPVAWTLLLAPFIAAVAVLMVGFGWLHLRRQPVAFGLMVAGVVAFLSVPVQEYVEIDMMRAAAGEGWERPVGLLLLEEGAELLGAMAVLAAALAYGAAQGAPVVRVSARRALAGFAGIALVIGLGGVVVSSAVGGVEGDDGNPRNRAPAALAFLVAVLCLGVSRAARPGSRRRRVYAGLGLVSLLASAYVGGSLYYFAGWPPLASVTRPPGWP